MTDLSFNALVWLTYRLGATFGFSLPLILLIWASVKKEYSLVRLLSIYFKVSSLIVISILLLTGSRPIGYLTSFISPLIILISIWFWSDLNEELRSLPTWKPLSFSVKLWRWSISFYSCLYSILTFKSLSCIQLINGENCEAWMIDPQRFHVISNSLFKFLFGANWTEPIAAFIGYIALIAYLIGMLQIIFIRIPKQGRVAGGF